MSEPLKVEALGPSPFEGMAEFFEMRERAAKYLYSAFGMPVRLIGVDHASKPDQGYLVVMQKYAGAVTIVDVIALVNSPDDCPEHDFSVQEVEFEYCRLCGTSRPITES